ncbi:MAG TPA: alpha/beta hydrolase [Candidatus Paceibacterota bacterium]|nr:alpha/beta hydrolase [Candidatus Paceibacterota bacterium]
MTKRVFIIHGWDGYPREGCFPWLKKNLEAKGFSVRAPAMPEPLNPKIDTWVQFLAQQIGAPDENTFLVGHSIGAQTILRYLEILRDDQQIGGILLLAGWVHLTDKAYEDEGDAVIAEPWLKTPIDWKGVRKHVRRVAAIFSDNDPLVPLSDAEIFKKDLDAEIIIEHNKGHFSGSDGITELPSALAAIEHMGA